MPGTVLSALHVSSHLILIPNTRSRAHCHLCFIDEDLEAWSDIGLFVQGHIAVK